MTPNSFQALKALGLAGVGDVLKSHVSSEAKLGDLTESFRANHRTVGKAMAAAKELHADAMNARTLPKMAFRDYHRSMFGEFPNNHAEACSNAFLSYVVTGLISEADYDVAATDWLETASTIVNAVLENGGDVTNENVVRAAGLLKHRPSDCAKQLKAIKTVVKPPTKKGAAKTEPEASTAPKPMPLDAVLQHAAAELAYVTGPTEHLLRILAGVDLVISAIERNPAFTAELQAVAMARRGETYTPTTKTGPVIEVDAKVDSAKQIPAAV